MYSILSSRKHHYTYTPTHTHTHTYTHLHTHPHPHTHNCGSACDQRNIIKDRKSIKKFTQTEPDKEMKNYIKTSITKIHSPAVSLAPPELAPTASARNRQK